jgi:hypothetical protein
VQKGKSSMTLVVQTRNRSTPTIMGDILVTSGSPGPSIILPAVGLDITGIPGIPRIIDLVQKIYILADNVCIAFTSNDIREIRDLLEDFRPFCSAGLPPEDIRKWVEEYNYSGFSNSSFLMTIVDNKGAGEAANPNVIALVKARGSYRSRAIVFWTIDPQAVVLLTSLQWWTKREKSLAVSPTPTTARVS